MNFELERKHKKAQLSSKKLQQYHTVNLCVLSKMKQN